MATGQSLIQMEAGEARSAAAERSPFKQRVAAVAALAGGFAIVAGCAAVAATVETKGTTSSPEQSMHAEMLAYIQHELGPDAPPSVNVMCFVEHCAMQFMSCGVKSVLGDTCMTALMCEQGCNKLEREVGHNRAPGCAYLCEMTSGYKSHVFTNLMQCGKDHKCLPTYPDDGECLATDADALQNVTSLDQLEGDWWVIKGINCGQVTDGTPFHSYPPLNPTKGKNFPGGYDWYPCQHERFVKSTGHDYPYPTTPWVNNITYCGGANGGLKDCNTSIIDTVANVTMCAPGVVCHNYIDAPLKPQYEHWRIISWPHPDYMFTIWCGQTPLLPYNGGITLSKNRDGKGMPDWVEENFRQTAKRFGVEWEQMCPSDNVGCP